MAIRITPQLFSGRPNPGWTLDDDAAAAVLERIAARPGLALATDRAPGRLGYRGVQIDVLSDALVSGLPASFVIDAGLGARIDDEAHALATELVKDLPRGALADTEVEDDARLHSSLRELFLQEMNDAATGLMHAASAPVATSTEAELAMPATAEPLPDLDRGCTVESAVYNPGFWNDPSWVRKNNCYCYGANRRINKFGRPGLAGGKPCNPTYTVENVRAGLIADGIKPFSNCLPDDQRPRFFMAMVVAPFKASDVNWNDFHFYRHSVTDLSNTNKFWSHKPGGTAVTDMDHAGRVIRNVESCDRWKYKLWGGYWYVGKSVRIDGVPSLWG